MNLKNKKHMLPSGSRTACFLHSENSRFSDRSFSSFRRKEKRTQHEMTGFIIIIVMVMVIGVIFLGISLRKHQPIVTIDAEISNFLIASNAVTTDCAQTYEPNYRTLEELAIDCYSVKTCLDTRNSCDVLKTVYNELLPKFKSAGTIKSYKLNYYFEQSNNNSVARPNSFISISSIQGSGLNQTCSSKRAGKNVISTNGGDIVQEVEICMV